MSSASLASGMEEIILVCAFGETVFTVMPKFESSFAAAWVNPMIPAFAAA
nr:hypothetical protein [Arthrobacter sp. OV608]